MIIIERKYNIISKNAFDWRKDHRKCTLRGTYQSRRATCRPSFEKTDAVVGNKILVVCDEMWHLQSSVKNANTRNAMDKLSYEEVTVIKKLLLSRHAGKGVGIGVGVRGPAFTIELRPELSTDQDMVKGMRIDAIELAKTMFGKDIDEACVRTAWLDDTHAQRSR